MKEKSQKPDSNEYEERMFQCMTWILYDKMGYAQFCKHVAKEFDCTARTAANYWADCKARIKEMFADKMEDILNDQLTRYFTLLKRAHEEGNDLIELNVLKQLDKIYGLEATKKIDVTSGGDKLNIIINLDTNE